MHLGKIIGTVTSTKKNYNLYGVKLVIIQPLDHNLQKKGDEIAAVDFTDSCEGEIVEWIVGQETAFLLPKTFAPVDAGVVGIVDEVNL